MFERFTERARRVIILAQEEAKRLNHGAVDTEHILLGIIREGEGVASKALESLNINPERLRAEIESAIGRGERTPYEEVAFSPRAKKVLELALDEARSLGHNYIGTEHLLLGLIREGEGVAARVLGAMGADLERVRAQVLTLLGEEMTFHDTQPEATPAPGPPSTARPPGMVAPGEPFEQTARRLVEIKWRLDEMFTYVQTFRTELQTVQQNQFWQFAALVLAVVALASAAMFFRR